jgi:hypothetical protein
MPSGKEHKGVAWMDLGRHFVDCGVEPGDRCLSVMDGLQVHVAVKGRASLFQFFADCLDCLKVTSCHQ